MTRVALTSHQEGIPLHIVLAPRCLEELGRECELVLAHFRLLPLEEGEKTLPETQHTQIILNSFFGFAFN